MFEVVATLSMAWAGFHWSRDGWKNQTCKFSYALASLWGVFEAAQAFGYIVKM